MYNCNKYPKEVKIMNDLSKNSALCKFKKFCCDLLNIQLKSDYHVKLSLYRDEKCEQPTCLHSINGSSKCRIINIITAFTAALIITSMLCTLCRCLKFKK